MKKILVLILLCLFACLTPCFGQYVYFSGADTYPQQCTGYLYVKAETNGTAIDSAVIAINYGDNIAYVSEGKNATLENAGTFMPNYSSSTGFFNAYSIPERGIIFEAGHLYARLMNTLSAYSSTATRNVIGKIKIFPKYKDQSDLNTVFSFHFDNANISQGTDQSTNDTTLFNGGNDIINRAAQNTRLVYTGTIVQTPCNADSNPPALSITDYNGGDINNKTKVDIEGGLKITLTDNDENGPTPLVFDSNGNWIQNPGGINDQYGIDLERSTVSIKRGGEQLLLGVSLKTLSEFGWTVTWDTDTWRGRGEKLNATIKVSAEDLRRTPKGDNFASWLNQHQVGFQAGEGDMILDWGVEQLITITIKAVDRAGNEKTDSVKFNNSNKPTVSQKSPTGTMINLSDPVSGKISDDWAGVKSGSIVVVLSGINEDASEYKYIFSGDQLNLIPVAGNASGDDYTYNITNHEPFPENGEIKVIVFAQDNQNNGVAYPNNLSDGLDNYTFTARPSCSEFQCCDDDIHIRYSNVNILNGTSVLYTGSTLTIVGGSGAIDDIFSINGITGYVNCGLTAAGVTFRERGSTRNERGGFTDLTNITGAGNGTFILQSGDDLIFGYMKDYVALSAVTPDPNTYITDVANVSPISFKLVGSEGFGDLLGVNDPTEIDLGEGWIKKYIVSIEIPSTRILGDNTEVTQPIKYVYETADSPSVDFNLEYLDSLTYGDYICPLGYDRSFVEGMCVPLGITFDPQCKDNQILANGECVCKAGYALDGPDGECREFNTFAEVCGDPNKPLWNPISFECADYDTYCRSLGDSVSYDGEQGCKDNNYPDLQWDNGHFVCELNQVYIPNEGCVETRDACGEGKYWNGSECVDPADALSPYHEQCPGIDTAGSVGNLCNCNSDEIFDFTADGGAGACVNKISVLNGGQEYRDLSVGDQWMNFDIYFSSHSSPIGFVDGTYNVEVYVVDIEDRISDPLQYSFMIDTTPPLCYISATQTFMCTGGNAITLTMTGDMTDGYSFMWSTDNSWTAGTQLTGTISTWGLYTGYVKDSAGNTGFCEISITNPEPRIYDYTIAGVVYTGQFTVEDLFTKMQVLEGTGAANCGTGNITLTVVECSEGVDTGVISNTDTLTVTLTGGVENMSGVCKIMASDAEGNPSREAKIHFALDTLAPKCDLSVDNVECEYVDGFKLNELAACGEEKIYNPEVGICELEGEGCDGTWYRKDGQYVCCPDGRVFNGEGCYELGEIQCEESTYLFVMNGVAQCIKGDFIAHFDDPSVIKHDEKLYRCAEEGYELTGSESDYYCAPVEPIDCGKRMKPEGNTCVCDDGTIYITSDMIGQIAGLEIEPEPQFDGPGCYPVERFQDCTEVDEGEICYGENLPIIVEMRENHGNVSTYQWDRPFPPVITGNAINGEIPGILASSTGGYKLTVVDEYGNSSVCDIEIDSDRLDLIAPALTATNAVGYECQSITGSVVAEDNGCSSSADMIYRWYNAGNIINGEESDALVISRNTTGTESRDITVTDSVGNQAGVTVSYTWNDLPLYINSGSYDLGTLLPEEGGVPSTGLDIINKFEAQEKSGTMTCGIGTGITLDSFACDLEFVTGAIDSVTGSIANIIVGEYATATGVSCTGTISDDDGNTTGFELTFDVGREGLIIGTPEGFAQTVTAGGYVRMKGFWIQDKRGWNTGHYTTIQSRGLVNTSNGNTVSVTLKSMGGSGLVALHGTTNTTAINQSLWEENGGVEFSGDSDPVLYFYRPNDPNNGGAKNYYTDELRLYVGDDVTEGTYTGEIVFTLYDRPFDAELNNTDGVYWNDSQGLISVVKNGVTQYTLQDKNLGASSTDIASADSYGNYYQWGNNFGFTTGLLATQGFVTAYSSNHRPNQLPLSRDMFYTGSYYDSSDNIIQSLWGVPQGGVVTSGLLNQGPCTGGYHIPTYNQWTGLLALLTGMDSTQLSNALKLPFAGYYKSDTATFMSGSSVGTYWMADWRNQAAVNLTIRNGNNRVIYDSAAQLQGNSLRCFKETVVDPTGDGWTILTALQ